jgi:methionine-rich copper-binding protein CopC
VIRGLLLAVLAMVAAAPPARAHAFLERASPQVGGEVGSSPPELSITFSEGVEPLFSTIELRDSAGAAIAAGKPHTAPGNDRRLVIELPRLPPGTYTVVWHATSVDTHKTEGSYHFTIMH